MLCTTTIDGTAVNRQRPRRLLVYVLSHSWRLDSKLYWSDPWLPGKPGRISHSHRFSPKEWHQALGSARACRDEPQLGSRKPAKRCSILFNIKESWEKLLHCTSYFSLFSSSGCVAVVRRTRLLRCFYRRMGRAGEEGCGRKTFTFAEGFWKYRPGIRTDTPLTL